VTNIKNTIEATPPELVADIHKRGVILTGGSSLLRGLDELVKKETRIPVTIIDDPLTTVVRGAGLILEDIDNLQEVLIPSAR
jgi:rod shape-determining protein MreB